MREHTVKTLNEELRICWEPGCVVIGMLAISPSLFAVLDVVMIGSLDSYPKAIIVLIEFGIFGLGFIIDAHRRKHVNDEAQKHPYELLNDLSEQISQITESNSRFARFAEQNQELAHQEAVMLPIEHADGEDGDHVEMEAMD